MMPLRITLLTMGRYRIMYLRLYTMIEQILLQGITLWTQNWENMPYTVSVASGDMYQWIVHLINIYGGYLSSGSIGLF